MSNDVGQVDLLNAQFQSVFSTGASLDLITPCHTTMLNGANSLVKKGTATLMITMIYMKDLNKPRILIPISSKSVQKRRSCGNLNI